ncbi:SdpI family protein [Cryobacterium algoricola]
MVLASVAVLVLLVTILCAVGIVPRNRAAGIRIPALLASDEGWRRGHRSAILPTAVGAFASVAMAIACLVQPSLQSYGPALVTLTLVAPLAWAVFRANRTAR